MKVSIIVPSKQMNQRVEPLTLRDVERFDIVAAHHQCSVPGASFRVQRTGKGV